MRFSSIITLAAIGIQSVLAGAPGIYYQAAPGKYVRGTTRSNVVTGNFTGYYYASNYYFESNQIVYIGYQPRDEQPNHLTFSVFGKGAFVDHPNCHYGADGPASDGGVSCAIDYPWKFDHEYNLEVNRTDFNSAGNNTWTGYLIDLETNESIVIGRIITGPEHGLLNGGEYIFDEFYGFFWYPTSECIPYSKYIHYNAIFYNEQNEAFPTHNILDVVNINPKDPYSSDPCSRAHNALNYNVTLTPDYAIFENGPYSPGSPYANSHPSS